MTDISSAIKQICEEKGLSYEAVLETIESALAAAYRKDHGKRNQNIQAEFDPSTGKSKVFDIKTVVEDQPEEEVEEVEEVEESKDKEEKTKEEIKIKENKVSEQAGKKKKDEKNKEDNKENQETENEEKGEEEAEEKKFNPKTDIQISDAKMIKKTSKIGDEIKIKLEVPETYGRMAAQTAKQVIIQKLREAEREMIFNDFKNKEKEVVSGVVQRKEGRIVLVDLGKTAGIIPPEEQIYGEKYLPGARIKVYVKEVSLKPKGPEIILSRTSEEILKKVFYLEIPEISNGLVEIKSVAREPGMRSKVAVYTDSENVDPIGSCVGQRGGRIQTIINELGGEKVDIIQYSDDTVKYISNALSPAKVLGMEINNEEKKAVVKVSPDQLSLAIGRSGQNARLAAHLTGWKIDIIEFKAENDKESEKKEAEDKKQNKVGEKTDKKEVSQKNQQNGKEEKEEKNTSTSSDLEVEKILEPRVENGEAVKEEKKKPKKKKNKDE